MTPPAAAAQPEPPAHPAPVVAHPPTRPSQRLAPVHPWAPHPPTGVPQSLPWQCAGIGTGVGAEVANGWNAGPVAPFGLLVGISLHPGPAHGQPSRQPPRSPQPQPPPLHPPQPLPHPDEPHPPPQPPCPAAHPVDLVVITVAAAEAVVAVDAVAGLLAVTFSGASHANWSPDSSKPSAPEPTSTGVAERMHSGVLQGMKPGPKAWTATMVSHFLPAQGPPQPPQP